MQRLPAPLGASPAGTSETTLKRCLFPPAADKRMNDADLNSFNNGLQAIINAYDERCAAMNVRRARQPRHAPLVGCLLLQHAVCCGPSAVLCRLRPLLVWQATLSIVSLNCALQCLNLTALPPSRRSDYNLDCAVDMGASASCPKSGTFNPKKPQ